MSVADPSSHSRWPREKIQSKLLELDTRRRIWERIQASPVIHLRGLARELAMPIGTLEHHLHLLERYEIVVSHRAARRRSFYPRTAVEPEDLSTLHFLSLPHTGRLLRELLAEPEIDGRELARRADLQPARASYYLGRLGEAGLIERWSVGRHTIYQLAHADRLERLLRANEDQVVSDTFRFLLERVRADQGQNPASRAWAPRQTATR